MSSPMLPKPSRRAAVVLATLVAGGVSAPLAAAATLSQFADQADAICGPASKKIDALKEPKTADGIVSYLAKAIAIAKPAQRKLEALELPDQKRATAKTAVRLSAKDITLVSSYRKALQRGQSVKTATKSFEAKAKANAKAEGKAWKSVGASTCAS